MPNKPRNDLLEQLGGQMDSQEIRTFLCVAQQGAFSAAAAELHVSQSTVSYRIAALEKAIGGKLVERESGSHSAHLTRLGLQFLDLANEWHELERRALTLSSKVENLAVGAPHSLWEHALADAVNEFGSQITTDGLTRRITTHSGTVPELLSLFSRLKIDVAMSAFTEVPADLQLVHFATEPMMLTFGKESDEAAITGGDVTESVDVSQLDTHSMIHIRWGPPFENWAEGRWDTRECLTVLDHSRLLRNFLIDSRRWAFVPRSFATILAAEGYPVRRVDSDGGPPDRRLNWAIARGRSRDRLLQEFVEFVGDRYRHRFSASGDDPQPGGAETTKALPTASNP